MEGQPQLFGSTGDQDADQVLPHLGAAGADFGAAIGIDLDFGLGLVRRATPQAGVFIARSHAPGIAFAPDLDGCKEIGGWRGEG